MGASASPLAKTMESLLAWLPDGFRFAEPWWLLLLLAPFALLAVSLWIDRRVGRAAIRYSAISMLAAAASRSAGRARLAKWLPRALRTIALALLAIAIARPQFGIGRETIQTQGVDIVLAVDLSGSMNEKDFKPNRLEVAKNSMREFIKGRPSDNIGLLGFGQYAAMLCPLTPEYKTVDEFIDRLSIGLLGRDTAIGDAMMLAAKRLERSQAKSKVIVLLTDGQQTAGKAQPQHAAEVAAALGVVVHTIGIGTAGWFGQLEFDPKALQDIADTTGGKYFHASDAKKFEQIFEEIDRLEKSRLSREVNINYDEKMAWFVWPAVLSLLLELFLSRTWLKRLP